MTAKELRKCLAKVPDDADICIGPGDNTIPMYDVKNNNVFTFGGDWHLNGTYVDIRKSKRDCPYLDKFYLEMAHRLVVHGKKIVSKKGDGKKHTICVVFSRWDEYLFAAKLRRHEWLTLCVDNVREEGMKLGVGRQWKVCEFSEYSGCQI